MLQGPGYPYEQVLKQYNNEIGLVMCAYLPQFQTFHRTRGMAVLLITILHHFVVLPVTPVQGLVL